jgi:hypothetical protein
VPTSTWNLNWLNQNSQRSYPLSAEATAQDQSGTFVLPNDFVVELDLAVHYGEGFDPARFFLMHLGAYGTGFSLVVGYQPVSGDAVKVATALIDRDSHVRNQVYPLGGIAPFDDAVGKVTIGQFDSIDLQPAGFWTFDYAGSKLEADAVRPVLRGISSIVLVNGEQRSDPIYGDVELTAGTNVQLQGGVVEGRQQIRIDAIEGAGLNEACVCEGNETPGPPIRTIMGIPPTPEGDFNILGSDCLKINPIANGVELQDSCAKPCCGCTELEAITRDYDKLSTQVQIVESLAQRLQSSVDAMSLAVASSSLAPCPP